MANQEHVDLLKQGVEAWNQWRNEHPDTKPDLLEASLAETTLVEADLRGALLDRANLRKADLSGADLRGASLREADFSEAFLGGTNFSGADLRGANFSRSDLFKTIFGRIGYIRGAGKKFEYSIHKNCLDGADFSMAALNWTVFEDVDLSTVRGLDTLSHLSSSIIGIDTIYLSHGNIPEVFLRDAGVPEALITYARSLIINPIDFYSCFISYSSKDEAFAQRLHADLQSNNVRCWFAPHHMKTGDKIRNRIDESILIYDKLLLILSEHSVTSTWVEHEVEAAFDKERLAREHQTPQTVLFPIKLDDAIMTMETGWPAKVRRERYITDFRQWRQYDAYQQALEHLLRDLKAEV